VTEVAATAPEGAATQPLAGATAVAPAIGRAVIPALTGLRFFAAFFVVLGHAQTTFVAFEPRPNLLLFAISALISIGMSLFFVLSGFVIHYNYGDLLRRLSPRNLATFYIARFARLYPLFLFFVVLDAGYLWKRTEIPAIPFYLGFAQTWTYLLIDGRGLISHLRYADVTWSISTEWFFYCCYPAIAWIIFNRRAGRHGPTLLTCLTLLCMALIAAAYFYQGQIEAFAQHYWGPAAVEPNNDSFFSWLVWFSPGRLHEFLGGVLAAQLYLSWRARPIGRAEERFGVIVLAMALTALVLLQAVHASSGLWHMRARVISPFIVPLATGTVLFCCARYKSLLARAMSVHWLILCGEASYSIYLFHVLILQSAAPGTVPLTWHMAIYVAVRFVLTLALLFVASIGFYHALERPARLWIRNTLGPRADRSTTVDWSIISVCVGLPTTLALTGWLISCGVLTW
jgi:peptidoglycan/LPS O-acetylase OafA/YrhL